MANPVSPNDLSILALVASDAAYRSRDLYEQDRSAGVPIYLYSYPDSTKDNEASFPSSLRASLSNEGLTAHTPGSGDGNLGGGLAQTIIFTNWRLIRKFQDNDTGFGAAVFKSTVQVGGKDQYIVAFQGSDGLDPRDWFADLDLARNEWQQDGAQVIDYLVQIRHGEWRE